MISNIKSTEGVGNDAIKKTIYAGAESIMFSVLQESQYMYPYKSAVREIVSNSLDSINERNTAVKLLNGDLKVSDVYHVKEGEEFKDSSFKPEYYDVKWFSKENRVTIEYVENDTNTRDRIKFIDNGVGLGGSRLINFFSLGFSSKRLSKSQIGGFGLGAKSLLATGVDFYTMTSFYQGKEYSFDIYKDHVTPAISKFNEDGSKNELDILNSGIEGDSDVEVYYRKTDRMNGVIVESEVKRHRKQDYVSGIKNQLGFIEDVDFVMTDGTMDNYRSKVNISNKILFNNGRIIVGESDYYAVPQILLTPGEGSKIRINYGTINWDELEMKKYAGNTCFIMNINEVDVTPSRENVIWNSRTRDAIKNMFITAQETVGEIVAEKLESAKNLPEHYYMFQSFTSRAHNDGLSELYKIVDLTEVESVYKGFSVMHAAKQLDKASLEKDFIFTSTIYSTGYNRTVGDTVYNSALSKSYIAKLARASSNKPTVYVGTVKYKNLARYVKNISSISYGTNIDIIYMKPEVFDKYNNKLKKSSIDEQIEKAYKSKQMHEVLIFEVLRFMQNFPSKVLLDEDIDKNKLSNIEKEEEKVENERYMSEAERAKKAGKVIGNVHYNSGNTNRQYFNEDELDDLHEPIIYSMSDNFAERLFRQAPYTSISQAGYNIIGFSAENFKRFYKHYNVRLLSDVLYTIEFGILKFTKLGMRLMDHNTQAIVKQNFTLSKRDVNFRGTPYHFLQGCFATTSVDQSNFKHECNDRVRRDREKAKDYIKLENKNIE